MATTTSRTKASAPLVEPATVGNGAAVARWNRLLAALVGAAPTDDRWAAVCHQLARSFGFTRAAVAVVDQTRTRLVTLAAYDPTITSPLYTVLSKLFATSLAPDADGRLNASAWCVVKQEQIYVPDSDNYSFRTDATYQRTLVVKALGGDEYVLTPIVWRGRSVGLLAADKKGTRDHITETDCSVLRAVADLFAVALAQEAAEAAAAPPSPKRPAPLPDGAAPAHFNQAWQMQSLLDALHEGLVVLGKDDTVRYLNRAAASLLNVIPWEVIGRPWREVLPVVQEAAFGSMLDTLRHAPIAGKTRWRLSLAARDVELQINVVPIASDRLQGSRALMVEDISQQAAVERMRQEFTSMLVHDLKAPLQGIVGFAELLHTERLGTLNDDQKRFVRSIEASGEHMIALAEGILEVAEFELGGSLMHKGQLRPHDLVAAALERLQGKALNAAVELRNQVPADLPPLFGDPVRLAETVQNLVDNAINASPRGATVRICAERATVHDRPYARFTVMDEGHGLDPDAVTHLFDKFWERERTDDDSGRSRGLGLVIARLVVEGHRGTIWAESVVGEGTTISFTLPFYRGPVQS